MRASLSFGRSSNGGCSGWAVGLLNRIGNNMFNATSHPIWQVAFHSLNHLNGWEGKRRMWPVRGEKHVETNEDYFLGLDLLRN
ncbi:hypothetical protein KIN20_018396 [Parelaphostrongylus tenuis]|uniref:Uncharacterized protein n=1 Tax=Parelaphostrongylus tenuis TaxID=148309 RepID=A0AAD5QRF2_PARTN|nr:hypothetical protein KIN20_018396 [Parelaphostrongylus tenuis]